MIFSINVHENVPFLLKQLDNIQSYVTEPHWIILSCNEYMYTELNKMVLPSHVIVNPEVIQKKVSRPRTRVASKVSKRTEWAVDQRTISVPRERHV